VLLASENGASLMLSFDGVLHAGGGLYPGSMPVLRDNAGVYRDLMNGLPVGITESEIH
jgi:hypothetical protein